MNVLILFPNANFVIHCQRIFFPRLRDRDKGAAKERQRSETVASPTVQSLCGIPVENIVLRYRETFMLFTDSLFIQEKKSNH